MSVIVNFNPEDQDNMISLMDKSDEFDEMLVGTNVEGEDVNISINHDHIIVDTYQTNGWVRKNIYWRDGDNEELFEGRWK